MADTGEIRELRNDFDRRLRNIEDAVGKMSADLKDSLGGAVEYTLSPVSPQRKSRRVLEVCSFCGKSKRNVGMLISGLSCYICDACVTVCQDLIDKEMSSQTSP